LVDYEEYLKDKDYYDNLIEDADSKIYQKTLSKGEVIVHRLDKDTSELIFNEDRTVTFDEISLTTTEKDEAFDWLTIRLLNALAGRKPDLSDLYFRKTND